MEKELIIGRCALSPIKIPEDKSVVSSHHIKITISDNGIWKLEDLQSANGTYIRDDEGQFHRVYNKQIHENDIIRLGNGGVNSYVFTARKAVAPDESYAYEFRQLRKLLKKQREDEAAKEKKLELNGWLTSATGAVVYGLTWVIGALFDISIDPTVRFGLMALAPILVKTCFSGDARDLKNLRKKREKILVCPNCGRPIAEFDIEQGQCSRCKAK